jgi:hypothetical protein
MTFAVFSRPARSPNQLADLVDRDAGLLGSSRDDGAAERCKSPTPGRCCALGPGLSYRFDHGVLGPPHRLGDL